jgi:quercetin dioxygenase-like cupin family protein
MDTLLRPKDAERLLPAGAKKTLHIDADDVPWVVQPGGTVDEVYNPSTATRVLHARPDEGFIVAQVRAEPGAVTAFHRHRAPAFALTQQGAWGHDKKYKYQPGVYVFEVPGVAHRFVNGPGVTEVTFIHLGEIEFMDPESHEITAVLTLDEIVNGYFAGCEQAGLPRPNILR